MCDGTKIEWTDTTVKAVHGVTYTDTQSRTLG